MDRNRQRWNAHFQLWLEIFGRILDENPNMPRTAGALSIRVNRVEYLRVKFEPVGYLVEPNQL